MRKFLFRAILALGLVVPAATVSVATAPQAVAQSSPYVAWAAHYGCETDGIHYRLTEHGMFVNGVPDHKRFYVDILIGGNMVHQNAYHTAVHYDVYPAGVHHIVYPGWHVADDPYPGTDTHHCRYVFSRWTHNSNVTMNSPNCGQVCWGFRGWDAGNWSVGGTTGWGWSDNSDWIEPQQQCFFSMDWCNGGTNGWWDRCNCWRPNGTYQDANQLHLDTFVDGY